MKRSLAGAAALILSVTAIAFGQPHLQDRGSGTPTSMFGTYIEKGELLFYPFYEHYFDQNAEYSPQELGFGVDTDFRGKYRASEGLVFVGYGLTNDLAIELEAAVIEAELERAANDYSGVPDDISESGLGDVQTQLNWRWMRETANRPAFFSYFETVYPLQKDKILIGTGDWEFKAGTGLIRGFSWGTVTFRTAFEYSRAEKKFELGEMAIEYLKRLSRAWRLYTAFEGTQDEIELITEAQWHFASNTFIRFNNAFGVTSKATDWAPELGVVFSIPTQR